MDRIPLYHGTGSRVPDTNLFGFQDKGRPYNKYFKELNNALLCHGDAIPCTVVDLSRFEKNIRRFMDPHISHPNEVRLAVKSLPCPMLIDHALSLMTAHKLMVFHGPFLSVITAPGGLCTEWSKRGRNLDIMMGKPLPVQAVRKFYESFRNPLFRPDRSITWLVDSAVTLRSYQTLAHDLSLKFRVCIEIDVGLHRGGVTTSEEFERMAHTIQADNSHFELVGLMGYDYHVVKAPGALLWTEGEAFRRANNIYAKRVEVLRCLSFDVSKLCLNGGGSATFHLHFPPVTVPPPANTPPRGAHTHARAVSAVSADTGIAHQSSLQGHCASVVNEVTVGSCLVKPSTFDVPSLVDFKPAMFAALPILKVLDGVNIPYLEWYSSLVSLVDPNWGTTLFLYGGVPPHVGDLASPAGLQVNPFYGRSTNQDMLTISRTADLRVGDYVFIRPKQSEMTMMMFGDVHCVKDGKVVAVWPSMASQTLNRDST